MRHRSRIGSSRRYALLPLAVLIFLVLLIAVQIAHGQTASTSPSQAADKRVAEPVLSTAWSEGVKALAAKIAAAVKPSRAISLEIKNISSLGVADMEAIRAALEAELRSQGLRIGSGNGEIDVTLSENADGYVWGAQIHRKAGEERALRVAIVSVPRAPAEIVHEQKELLVLSQRLVWEQAAKMLDFAIVASTSAGFSRLLVLGTEDFRFYRADGGGWELERDVPIPHSIPWPRNVRGWIDIQQSRAYIQGVVCDGDFSQPESVQCGSSDPKHDTSPELRIEIQGRENVDTATVGPTCGKSLGTLATGTNDWTQSDSIQGYVSEDGRIMESGVPIEMDGPVMSIYPTETAGSARAVVWNLKTRNYEAYIVTATCNH